MTDFTHTRAQFHIPQDVIYLDGNSLGPMPKSVSDRVQGVIHDEWSELLIRAWNKADWITLPRRVGDKIAALIGAAPDTVTTGDTLTIKVFQAASAALNLRPKRRVILSDNGNFPTDLYVAQGLLGSLGPDYELRVVAPEEVDAAITDEIAAIMLTHVDYKTGRMHDMRALTQKAHDAGALAIWDLAHSAGAFALDLAGCDVDLAVGCSYKYLNGGPGAPAFIYVKPELVEEVAPILAGWMGHKAPFDFDLDYRPAKGVERMRVGTPPIVQLSMLDEALNVWEGVDMNDLRARSVALCEQFITEVEASCPGLTLASPREAAMRGSQVSFAHKQGFAVMQAMAAAGVIGDFRAPDIMRFGFTPLYIDASDVSKASSILADILESKRYEAAEFQVRGIAT